MKKILYFQLLTLGCVFLCLPTMGQRILNSARIETMPPSYAAPTGQLADINQKKPKAGPNSRWIVFSDRDDNTTFSAPYGGNPVGNISFMQSFYVIEQHGEFLRLAEYDPLNIVPKSNKLKRIKEFGWIHQGKLLLWKKALRDPETNFELKALTVNSINDLEKNPNYIGKKRLQLFNSPVLEKKFENKNDVRLYEFLFILKESDDAFLVAKTNDITGREGTSAVLGWVPKNLIHKWKQRIALEPNWDQNAVTERKSKKVKASLFNSHSNAINFHETGRYNQSNILWDKDTYEKRKDSYWKRLPVLETFGDGVVKTGFVTNIFDEEGKKILNSEEYLSVVKDYNRVRDQFRKINMVFVLDGTPSMQPYFPSIVNVLETSINVLKETKNEYHIGAVIYYDENMPLSTKQLSKNYASTLNFIQSKQTNQDSYLDKENPTALGAGLDMAARMLKRDETNIIILVGDASGKINTDSILEKLEYTGCNLLAFQARSTTDLNYLSFISQTKEIIQKTTRYKNSIPKLKRVEGAKNSYRVNYPDSSSYAGSLVHANINSSFPSQDLEKEISGLINEIERHHVDILQGFDSKILAMGPKKVFVNPAIERLIDQLKVPKEVLEKVRDNNFQLFVEAYATVDSKNLDTDIFKYVLFISEHELYQMLITLERLSRSDLNFSKLRDEVEENYKQAIRDHFGDDRVTRREISKKTPNELIRLVTGLPSRSALLDKYTINELGDKRRVSDLELQSLNASIRNKYDLLKKIAGNPQFNFRSIDETYYWIPQEYLP